LIKVFSHWLPSKTVYELLFDFFLVVTMVLGAAWLDRDNAPALGTVALYAFAFALLTTALNRAIGFYHLDASRGLAHIVAIALVSFFLATPVAYAIFNELPTRDAPNRFLQVSALLALAAIVVIRIWAAHSSFMPVLARRVMVLGTGPEAKAVEQSLRPGQFRVVGFYPLRGDATDVPPARLIPTDSPLVEIVRKLKVNEIIVAVGERRGGAMPLNELLECKLAGVRVLDLSSYFERALGQVRLDSLRASWLIFGDGFRQGLLRTIVKRIFDVAVAAILLVVTLPLMLITALLILLESGFPIFYRQERVGLAGRIIRVTKFRSMRTDAEVDGKPRWAASNDERVTRMGRFIRKYRIDELPQLVNVLKGDMSLVGPRPERPFFVEQLTQTTPFYAARHSVKPGLTGWAQVRYHYGATMDDAAKKLQFDLYYVKNHSLFLDLVVLFETVVVVVTGKGAQ
jgi:sugar transferase (PEP-CTERM system associated)